ncbi:hypothetical protein [Nonomuraea sp. NPDC049784]
MIEVNQDVPPRRPAQVREWLGWALDAWGKSMTGASWCGGTLVLNDTVIL